jgi:DNA-binding transcriptional LysR family regulator
MPRPETLTDFDAAVLLQCAVYEKWPAISAWNMIVRSRHQGVVYVQSPDLLHELVLGGAGVALLPAIAHKSNYNLVPLPGPFGQFFPVDVWFAANDGRRHEVSVKRLAALIVDHFSTKQAGILSR